jgi:ribonuclease HI
MKTIVFTDGSVPNNQAKHGKCGGIGVFFGDNDPRNISETFTESTHKITNNTMEFLAVIKAIETIEINNQTCDSIIVVSDSEYLIKSMTEWVFNWEKNNWKKSNKKPVENIDYVKKLHNLTKKYNVKYKHQRSHKVSPSDKTSKEYKLWYGNDMADKLAFSAAKKC